MWRVSDMMTADDLKYSILQLAMQGKLVEQRSEEGTGESLYQIMRADREKLIRQKKIKKDKPLSSISEDELLYDIPQNWKAVRVGEIGSWSAGATPSRSHPEYYGGNIPWLKTGEVQNNVIFETEEYISEAGLKNSSAKLIPAGSVVMAMYGATAAQVGYLQCETTTNQACCNMICKSEVDAAFLYFHFLVNQEEIKRLATGGAQENLSQDVISAQPNLIIEDDSVKQPFSAIMRKFVCCFKEIKILTQMQTLLLSKMGVS